MRSCIFVDGENFRHSLKGLFPKANYPYLPQGAKWQEFFDHLAIAAYPTTRMRTYWYTVANLLFSPGHDLSPEAIQATIRQYGPKEYRRLLDQSGASLKSNLEAVAAEMKLDRERMERRFHSWRRQQDGISVAVEALEFRRAGSIRYSLYDGGFGSEKAVDVKLATDLLELRSIYDVAIIISGDQDYVPAVQIIKDSGKRVVNVVFRNRKGDLLPGGAQALNLICDKTLSVGYDEVSKFMSIAPTKPASTALATSAASVKPLASNKPSVTPSGPAK